MLDGLCRTYHFLLFDTLPKKPTSKTFKVLLIGGIHGDETAATKISLKWTKRLLNQAQNQHWRILPLANPDSIINSRGRTNINGVDINRNFPAPSGDNSSPLRFWQNDGKNKRYFPGKYPISQPESQFIHQQIESFSPNLIISLHAPYGSIDFDGPSNEAPKKLHKLKKVILPTSPGSLGNYAWSIKGIPTLTIEIGNNTLTSPLEEHYLWFNLLDWIETTYLNYY